MQTNNTRQPLSFSSCNQLFYIKEQIREVNDILGVPNSDKVLVTTAVFNICRSLFRHIGSFKIHISIVRHNANPAMQIQIFLHKSDAEYYLRDHKYMSDVPELDLIRLHSIFDYVNLQIMTDPVYVITLTKGITKTHN